GETSSTDFPATGGPGLTYNGGIDAFVAKVKADGTGLIYAGYIGGSGDDYGLGIAVDRAGNAYVAGYTLSTDFPVAGGPSLIYRGGRETFVAKIGTLGFLTFPLHNKAPFDAKFTSVFDHSMSQQYCPDD